MILYRSEVVIKDTNKESHAVELKEKKYKSGFTATKEGGYLAQKRYREAHPDRVVAQRKLNYAVTLRFPASNKEVLDGLIALTGLTAPQLFLRAVEEKYGVVLQKQLTNKK